MVMAQANALHPVLWSTWHFRAKFLSFLSPNIFTDITHNYYIFIEMRTKYIVLNTFRQVYAPFHVQIHT